MSSYKVCCWGKSKSSEERKQATEEWNTYTNNHCEPCSKQYSKKRLSPQPQSCRYQLAEAFRIGS